MELKSEFDRCKVGGTSLAREIYNQTKNKYDICNWVHVAGEFSKEKIYSFLLASCNVESVSGTVKDQLLIALKGRSFMFVFDNIYEVTSREWQETCSAFELAKLNSCILVTTRNRKVARDICGYITTIDLLTEDNLKVLFESVCFNKYVADSTKNGLSKIQTKILRQFGGLPLAAVEAARILKRNYDVNYWKDFLREERWRDDDGEIMRSLKLSFHYLPGHFKSCLLWMCIFPKNHDYHRHSLVRYWISLGYIAVNDKDKRLFYLEGDYIDYLTDRSLIMFVEDAHKLHPLMRDMGLLVASGTHFHAIPSKLTQRVQIPVNCNHVMIRSHDFLKAGNKLPERLRTVVIEVTETKLDFSEVERLKGVRVLIIDNRNGPNFACKLPKQLKELIQLSCLHVMKLADPNTPNIIKRMHCLLFNKFDDDPSVGNVHGLVSLRSMDTYVDRVFQSLASYQDLEDLTSPIVIQKPEDISNIPKKVGGTIIIDFELSKNPVKELQRKLDELDSLTGLVFRFGESDFDLDSFIFNPSLRIFSLEGYQRSKIPECIYNHDKLSELALCNCQVSDITPIGGLKCLRKLHIFGLQSLEMLGKQISGDENNNYFFPSLEEVDITYCKKLEKWSLTGHRTFFQKLEQIEISFCESMKEVPFFCDPTAQIMSMLKIVKISYSKMLSDNLKEWLSTEEGRKRSHSLEITVESEKLVSSVDCTSPPLRPQHQEKAVVKFTATELPQIMDKPDNIRNISVIASVDHGKSTLTGSLVAAAGIAGDIRMTDTRQDEAEQGITIKSTGISLYYEMTKESLKNFKGPRNGNGYLINLIDSPEHVDYSSEVTAALHITDGALVVVDCIEGVCVQTETVLRQALGERIRPVLTLNKMDQCFLELQVAGEEAYQTFQRVIEKANVVMAIYQDSLLGEVLVYPEKGTVAFSAGLHGWAFTLKYFAKMYASKFGVDESKMMDCLWGENFFDPDTQKWTSKNTGSPTCKHGFVQFCYELIGQIISTCMKDEKSELWSMLTKLGVTLKAEQKELNGKALMERVMQTWLPASSALLEMMIFHLPSPVAAQRYRVDNLYKGPLDDVYANAIRNCDPHGPLMLYESKMIPASDKGRFFAFGRVFSGKVSTGMKVRIMGPNYIPGQKKDLYVETVQRTVIWMGKKQEFVKEVPCGNTVAMVGLDQFITKNATLTNEGEVNAHPSRQ